MIIKKLWSAVISAVMMLSLLTFLPANPVTEKISSTQITAEAAGTMRRPCSSQAPMWIVHIETWNHADPQKIINLIPEDIRPYVVFNISMSIYWIQDKDEWGMVQDGYELAKSWIKACADEGIWCMIQPSSGGQCHFPDYDLSGNIVDFPNKGKFVQKADADYENTIYAEFFRDYPNFIGFNYCEQFWGFDQEDFPISCPQRYQHFAKLLKLCNKYGGYLDISWCGNEWSPKINPLAMLKQVPQWEEACRLYSDNLILEEKYTQASYIADVESLVYGYYVSGYCGNFGIRYDETGWTDSTWSGSGASSKDQFNQATGLPIYLERMVKNGATVIDGPELTTVDDFKETNGYTDSEGYHVRDWAMYDQFQNVPMDFMRKIADGTVRIPTREEVVSNTKVVIIHDVADDGKPWGDTGYSTYPTLFEGLYRMSGDGNLKLNHNLYKSTGRYQTIPTVYALKDDLAKSIPVQVKQSEIASRWSTIEAKQNEFNKLYPFADYYGNCYAGRNQNSWVAYNSNKDGSNCGAVLSLKYNTCKDLDVNFNAYGNALINEYSDHIDIYLNNYDNKHADTRQTDTIKISGCSSEPTITYKDRGVNQLKSEVSTSYSNGTYTITVKHNGPLDISVKCSGSETNRSQATAKKALTPPAAPDFYTGVRQYEAELFDQKNIEGNVANACGSGITGIQGQGFMKFGTKNTAAVKDTVSTTKAGTFKMTLRYAVTSDISCVDLYVNGSKVKTLSLPKGSSLSDWKTVSENITLKQGDNKIELKANATLPSSLYLDNFTVEGDFGDATQKELDPISGTLIKNLVRLDKENGADWSIETGFTTGTKLFGDRDITATSVPSNLRGAEYIRTACDSKLIATDLGTFTAGADITVYIAVDTRVTANLPSWLGSWTKTDSSVTTSNDLTLQLYKKNFNTGDSVTLGTNGGSNESVNYVVVAVPKEVDPISGKLIKDLTVFDKENADDWSIYDDFKSGSQLYGDRDITAVSVPKNLIGAETIRTACDSKLLTTQEGKFTAGADATVYAAVDSRVTGTLPEWLKAWSYAGTSVTTSNDVTLQLYKLNVKSGDVVALGTNSGSGNAANYIISVVPQENIIKGDVNLDGVVNVYDLVAAKRGNVSGFTDARSFDAADVDKDEKFESDDLEQIQNFLLSKNKSFAENPITKPEPAVPEEPEEDISMTPDEYMAMVSANILESEPSDSTEEKSGVTYGTYEKKTIYSEVCKRNKSFNVLLPAGYSTAKKYPVLYVLHGYWGDEDALLDAGDASLRLRQIIGNAIAAGEAEDMIVVFPDIYASDTQDKCDGLDAKNNAAYDNFINLLVKEIMPYMEQNYSIKTGRDNTAITGFSMGGRESLNIGFTRPDLFGYVGAMCSAPGLMDDQIPAENLKFTSNNPYMLFISAGSNDTLIWSTPAGYHDTLNTNGVTHIWHYVTGGDHGGKTIRPHMYNFIRHVFKAS